MLAADDVPVLMHDPTLERTGLVSGAVSALPAAELGRVDVGGWHSPRFIGETVPTLERTLRFCRDHVIWPNIEIKPVLGFEAATGAAVARVTSQYTRTDRDEGDRSWTIDRAFRGFCVFAYCADRGGARCAESAAGLVVDDVPPIGAKSCTWIACHAYGSSKSDRCARAKSDAARGVLLHGKSATRSKTLQLGGRRILHRCNRPDPGRPDAR